MSNVKKHGKPAPCKPLAVSLGRFASALACCAAIIAGTVNADAGTFYWDTDGSTVTNNTNGTGLGGTGTWDGNVVNKNWWITAPSSLVLFGNTNADIAVFTGAYAALPTLNTVTLAAGRVANQLSFLRSGYTLTGGTLTLAGSTPQLFANLGETVVIDSQILGLDGLLKTGGGTIRLVNSTNSYTGTTTVDGGVLAISSGIALGASATPIVVNGATSIGDLGGSLLLDGLSSGFTVARNLSLQGQGLIGGRGATVLSSGNNTLSGTVSTAVGNVSTRIIAADGTLTFNAASTVDIQGTAGTHITTFGGVNQSGVGFYNVLGTLSGTGTLESSGGGTLFLSPSSSLGFNGVIRVSQSAAVGQSDVRIGSAGVLGTRNAVGTGSVLEMNGGILAVLMDAPSVLAGITAANVYGRASSAFFADHAPNSTFVGQTVTLGVLAFEEGQTFTLNARNGYGIAFGAAPVQGGTNNSTFNNNIQGGGVLTFNGNFWSNADNSGNRTMNIGGNGNTLINGDIIASAGTFSHSLTKTGTGTLTISGTASTLDGSVNINGGTVAINDFRSITNNGSAINIGTLTTAGTLSVTGTNLAAVDLTTSKVINLAGTTGAATILANQTGTSPGLIFNANFSTTGNGVKTLTLGGANTLENTINGNIVNGASATALVKTDADTWTLTGTNTYTGSTTIANGTLKLRNVTGNASIVTDGSAIIFGVDGVTLSAGGTLEFIGANNLASTEKLGALTPTAGAGTVQTTRTGTGSAGLTFASLAARAAGATVNYAPGAGASTPISFTAATVTNGILVGTTSLAYSTFLGVNWATISAGNVAPFTTYTTLVASPLVATTNYSASANVNTAVGAASINTLKLIGGGTNPTITLGGVLTLTAGAVLFDNTSGTALITGSQLGAANVETIIIANGSTPGNALTVNSLIGSGTGLFTKSGTGTVILGTANTYTGNTTINQGTLKLSGATATLGTITTPGNVTTIRQGATLDINAAGASATVTIGALNGAGTVTNSGGTQGTLSIGSSTSTAAGIFSGLLQNGTGVLNVTKNGTGAQTLSNPLNSYTGVTTIGSTGIVTVTNLANGGVPSSIGASLSAAPNLVFSGASPTQAFGGLSYNGTADVSTNRLFTFGGTAANSGARIQANGVNQATLTFSNTGALAFGTPNVAQGLVLGGSSTGDNRFFPVINNNGASGPVSLFKADAGVWWLMGTNGYTGATRIDGGTLFAQNGVGLSPNSNLVLSGGSLGGSGSFTRTVGIGGTQVQWTANGSGGFSAGGAPLTVDLGPGNVWGTGPFIGTGALLLNNSGISTSDVKIVSGFQITQGIASTGLLSATTTAASPIVNLTSGTTAGLAVGQTVVSSGSNIPAGFTIATIVSATQFTLSSGTGVTAGTSIPTNILAGGYRQVNVGDFTSVGSDFATISGVITGAGNLAKEGAGILQLRGSNTYTGQTLVRQGNLAVVSLGSSTSAASSSVGSFAFGNANAGAIAIGNGGTGAAVLEYVGAGETSDRKIRLNTTTGSVQIHADGVGALVLTNVANDMVAGIKTLFLRGVSQAGNKITSQLSDNGGALGITVDGSAIWILTNPANNYTGTTTANGGTLGIGADTALGTGPLALSNGSAFAYGADRTLTNELRQNNNTTSGFQGDYSINIAGNYSLNAAATTVTANNNIVTTNNIVAGKTLIFGNISATIPARPSTWILGGSGATLITGVISNTAQTLNVAFNPTTPQGTLTLSGVSTYNGDTIIQNGRIIITGLGASRLPVTTDLILGATGTAGVLQIGDASGPSQVTVGSIAVGNVNQPNAIVGGNPTVSTLTINNTVDFNIPIQIGKLGPQDNTTITNPENKLKLVKIGVGTANILYTNYYTGGTEVGAAGQINGGTLRLNSGNATFGHPDAPTTILTVYGGTADIALGFPVITDLNLGGGAGISTARVALNTELEVRGAINYNATNNPNPAIISGVSALVLNPTTSTTITVASSAAGSGGALAPDITISAAINGPVGGTDKDIIKEGPGTLRLVANSNTFWQGRLFVNAGTLILDGSPTTAVLANAVQITVGTGKKLDFGASSGEIINLKTLTLQNNSTLVFNLGATNTLSLTSSDNLQINDPDSLSLGTGLKINVNALSGFGLGRYTLIEEQATSDLGVPFTLGTTPGGFSYVLGRNFVTPGFGLGAYELFLDVSVASPAFFWKGSGANRKWTTAGNWVDAPSGAVSSGNPGLSTDVFFSANSPVVTTQVTTIVDINLGVKKLTVNDPAVSIIKGAGTILSIANGMVLNGGPVTFGSATPGEALNLSVSTAISDFQSWKNNSTGTLTILNQVFSEGTSGVQVLSFDGSNATVISGNIINGGLGGTLAILNTSPSLTLDNSGNTYTGGTQIGGGTVKFKAGALPVVGQVEFTGNATLQWDTSLLSPSNTDDISGRLKINDTINATLDTNGNDVTFASILQNGAPTSGKLIKTGGGTLKLAANNQLGGYTGGTDINGGAVEFGTGAFLNFLNTPGNVTYTGSSTLTWSVGNTDDISDLLKVSAGVTGVINTNGNDVIFASPINNLGPVTTGTITKAGAGTLSLDSLNTPGQYSGGTNILAGTLAFAEGALPASGLITFTGSSTLQWGTTANPTVNVAIPANDISSRLRVTNGVTGTIDTNGNDVVFASPIQTVGGSNASLTKAGEGKLTLGAISAFTGTTSVAAGTLAVSGSLSGTTAVSVAAGATVQLLGSNAINSLATVTTGAGTSANPATIMLNGLNETMATFALAGDTVIDFGTFATIAQLKFAPSAGIAWASGATLSINNWSGTADIGGGVDQLFFGSNPSGLTSGQLANILFFSDDGVTLIGGAKFTSAGEVVPVPEPASLMTLLGSAGLLMGFRRRRQREKSDWCVR